MSMRKSFSRNLNNTAEVCASPILCSSVLRIATCHMINSVFHGVSTCFQYNYCKDLQHPPVDEVSGISWYTNSLFRTQPIPRADVPRSAVHRQLGACRPDILLAIEIGDCPGILEAWKSCCGSRASQTWQMPLFRLGDGSC